MYNLYCDKTDAIDFTPIFKIYFEQNIFCFSIFILEWLLGTDSRPYTLNSIKVFVSQKCNDKSTIKLKTWSWFQVDQKNHSLKKKKSSLLLNKLVTPS